MYDKAWLDNGNIVGIHYQSNISLHAFYYKLDVQNGQPVAGERMVIVMEEICPVLTILETRSITKTLNVDLEPDEWIKDSGCSKDMTGNRKLFTSYKAYYEGNASFGSNLCGNIIGKGQIFDNKCRATFSEHASKITKDGKVIERMGAKGEKNSWGDKSAIYGQTKRRAFYLWAAVVPLK
ncbi:hypothetical protein Tco_0339306 [Tanacetum coccineum]